jgi:hypothetical protein
VALDLGVIRLHVVPVEDDGLDAIDDSRGNEESQHPVQDDTANRRALATGTDHRLLGNGRRQFTQTLRSFLCLFHSQLTALEFFETRPISGTDQSVL